MKKYIVLAAAILVVGFAAAAMACPGGGCKGDGNCAQGGCFDRMYDPAKVETVTGQVVSLEPIACRLENCQGIGLTLNTGAANIVVHLGPQWYLDQQAVKLAAGDRVEIKGSKTVRGEETFLIAAEVKKGSEVLKLRDENNAPAWAGPRKGECRHAI
jgi:hypothetical protein